MKLADWLTENELSQTAFAQKIGSSQSQVARFAAGTRMPRKQTMRKIKLVTGGAVTANDFYELDEDGKTGRARRKVA